MTKLEELMLAERKAWELYNEPPEWPDFVESDFI
jgi:undecaprenyl pyrophosphate synthase